MLHVEQGRHRVTASDVQSAPASVNQAESSPRASTSSGLEVPFASWTIFCAVGALLLACNWDTAALQLPAEPSAAVPTATPDAHSPWLDVTNAFAAGVSLLAAATALVMRMMYDHRQRLGTLSGKLDDMPITVAMMLIVCALLFGTEAVVAVAMSDTGHAAGAWALKAHVVRIVYLAPVLHSIYTTTPPASSQSQDHLGRLHVPLLLNTGVCAAMCVIGPLIGLRMAHQGGSQAVVVPPAAAAVPSTTPLWLLNALRDPATLARLVATVLMCVAGIVAHTRYTRARLPSLERVESADSRGVGANIAMMQLTRKESQERRSLREMGLRVADTLHRVAVVLFGACLVAQSLLNEEDFRVRSTRTTLAVLITLCEAVIACASPMLYVINQLMAVEEHDATDTELKRSRLLLEGEHELGEARRRFLRYVFHEVRVPFNSIVLGLQALQEASGIPPLARDHIGMMQAAAQGMSTIMNGVLQLGAIEEGRFHISPTVASVAAMLRNVAHQLTPWAAADSIQFHTEIDAALPAGLLVDTQRLSQVVNNLCTNAFKFVAHDGSGIVTLRAVLLRIRKGEEDDAIPASISLSSAGAIPTGMRNNDTIEAISLPAPVLLRPTEVAIVHVEVQDNGCGIDTTEIPKLFVPYFQIRSGSDAKTVTGTGLGLSIAKQIVAEHGGQMHVTSVLGKGSVFSFDVALPFPLAALVGGEGFVVSPPHSDGARLGGTCAAGVAPMAAQVREFSVAAAAASAADPIAPLVELHPTSAVVFASLKQHRPGPPPRALVREKVTGPLEENVAATVAASDAVTLIEEPVDVPADAESPAEVEEAVLARDEPHASAPGPDVSSQAKASAATAATASAKPAQLQLSLARPSILVVDDVSGNRMLLMHLMRNRYPHSTIAGAVNGQEVLDLYDAASREAAEAGGQSAAYRVPFDVIMMDGSMPIMDGQTATRILRQRFGPREVLILACTGNALAEDRTAFLDAGADLVLTKPIDVAGACGVINTWLRRRALEE